MSFELFPPPGLWTVWQNTQDPVARVTEFSPVMLRSWAVPLTPLAGGMARRRVGARAMAKARRQMRMAVVLQPSYRLLWELIKFEGAFNQKNTRLSTLSAT